MTQVLQWGPFALPWALLPLVAAVGAGFLAGGRAGRKAGLDAGPPLWRLVLAGAVAARLAFVWQWQGPYLRDPLSVLDLRDGGWNAEAGIAAACLYALAAMGRRPALRRPLTTALAAAFAAGLAGSVALAFAPGEAARLPPLELRTADGRALRLADLAGRPVVVNLWASWCPPCRHEMPVLRDAQAAHPGVEFVFVNQGESAQRVRAYLDGQGLALRNVLLDPKLEAGAALGLRILPGTFFYDAAGRLAATRVGALSAATLARQLDALGTAPAAPPAPPSASRPERSPLPRTDTP